MRAPALSAILVGAVVVRGALLLAGWGDVERFLTPDSAGYDALARNLLEKGEFSLVPGGRPEIFRAPGYPFFLAAAYALTGGSVQGALAFQVALDVLLCYLVWRLGRTLCSPGAGLIAAGVQAITPVAVAAGVRVLSDSLFALLLVAGLAALVGHFRTHRPAQAAAGGAVLGLACLVRPIGLAVVAAAAVVIAWPFRRHWRAAIGFLASAGAVLAPWVVRNALRAGYVGISGVADFNLFFYGAAAVIDADPRVEADSDLRLLNALRQRDPAGWPEPDVLNDPAFLRRSRREGLKVILRRPLTYAAIHLRTTLNVFLPGATDVLEVAGATAGRRGTLGVLQREGVLAAVRHYFGGAMWALWVCVPMLLIEGAKYLAALAGLLARVRRRMNRPLWLILLAGACLVLLPGPPAHARFRVPVEPLLSLAAGAGVVWLARKIRKGPAPRA